MNIFVVRTLPPDVVVLARSLASHLVLNVSKLILEVEVGAKTASALKSVLVVWRGLREILGMRLLQSFARLPSHVLDFNDLSVLIFDRELGLRILGVWLIELEPLVVCDVVLPPGFNARN